MRMFLAAAALLAVLPKPVSSAGSDFSLPSLEAVLTAQPAPGQVPALEGTWNFDPEALKQCERHPYNHHFNQCLMIIQNRRFERDALMACSENNRADAINLCLSAIADARFQNEALELCERHESDYAFNGCMHGIREKSYTPQEIKVCRGRAYPTDVNECLLLSGAPMPEEPSTPPVS